MKKLIYMAMLLGVVFSSCSTTSTLTRGGNYPLMYEEKPQCIVIMPPINKTTSVEAKEYFYTSLARPLCEKGYYVISPFLAMEMFKNESAYDSELFIDGSAEIFGKVFDSDAILFTVINEWSKSAIGNTITVDIDYILKSTKTNEILFKRNGRLTVDTSINTTSGGAIGALAGMVASAVKTALTDKVVAARRCNDYILYDMPDGIFSPNYGKDMEVKADKVDVKATVKQ